ncbi:MFS transporter [Actinoplanes sp. TBRC 11911]|uniref:MFS transporter n=1 Tax=Actinoplanes sp. TBRC 11911 TaxID=2729386 RepID=UPI002896A225|nr:MFS transporter [Actinoplanes sp. TBRC 11911]
MLLYPVYALLFADRGLSTAELSTLFALWSVVSFVAEIPSGALADTWSRRKLYALGEWLTAAGYAVWIVWPAYPGFALGFVLWGVGGALGSGTLEALVYDELQAEGAAAAKAAAKPEPGKASSYARIVGRGNTVATLAILVATLVAAPAWSFGGYALVGAVSIAVKLVGGALALRLPESARGGEDDDDESGYFRILRDGVRQATGSKRVVRAVLVAALVPGFTALDEYLPVLARDHGATTASVPLFYAVTALAMAAGSALAGRYAAIGPRPPLLVAAVLLTGALIPHPAGMIAVSAAFGLLEFAMIAAETRLQDTITGRARTTVLSVAGFASEVFAVCLYGLFAVPAPLTWLFVVCAIPLLLTALAA